MLREWLSDLRIVVTHVFVSAELREVLLDYGRASPEFACLVPMATDVLRAAPNHADHRHGPRIGALAFVPFDIK